MSFASTLHRFAPVTGLDTAPACLLERARPAPLRGVLAALGSGCRGAAMGRQTMSRRAIS